MEWVTRHTLLCQPARTRIGKEVDNLEAQSLQVLSSLNAVGIEHHAVGVAGAVVVQVLGCTFVFALAGREQPTAQARQTVPARLTCTGTTLFTAQRLLHAHRIRRCRRIDALGGRNAAALSKTARFTGKQQGFAGSFAVGFKQK